MCGIAGVIRRDARAGTEEVDRMLAELLHRGPDSWASMAQSGVCVGQTRLRVIDLVTGDPPITTPDGDVAVGFNGEIYNFRALRHELAGAGHRFATSGDTEVIAHLAEAGDPVALAQALEGMFAIGIADHRTGALHLVRDRFGKKPLYWYRTATSVVYASEIKALLVHPDVTARLDERAIPAYLGLGYVPTPHTFFDGIQSVPPGHVLSIDADLTCHLRCYWELPLPGVGGVEHLDVSLEDAATLVRKELLRSVEDRLVADVPVGAFLSGGLDSTAVVGLLSTLRDRVRTFTIGFEAGTGFDEREYARVAAARFGTDHEEFVVRPNAAELVERLVWHHDQPFGDSSALPTFLLAEMTRRHVTVALSGDGGDELFGGYERFAASLVAARLGPLGGVVGPAVRVAGRTLERRRPRAGARLVRMAGALGSGMPDALRRWTSYIDDELVDELVGPGNRWGQRDYAAHWERTAGAHPLDRILRLNAETYLLDDLLPKADRMSMAHALEVRSPFLDHRLAELAFLLPPATKVRGLSLKRALRAAVADIVPREILDRPKKGFGVPVSEWFRTDLKAMAASLAAPSARVAQHLDPTAIRSIVDAHADGRADHGSALWAILTLELFLERMGW